MKKLLSPFCLLLLLASCSTPSAEEQGNAASQPATESKASNTTSQAAPKQEIKLEQDEWQVLLSGSLDDKIMIEVDLARSGKLLKGSLTYKSQGKPIRIFGHVMEPNTFFIREYAKGTEVSGVLSGEFKGDEMIGEWYPPSGEKTRILKLKAKDGPAKAKIVSNSSDITGKYSYTYPNEGGAGTLELRKKDGKIQFDASAHTGAPGYRMAIMEEAEATLKDNVATCIYIPGECEFTITFAQDFAFIDWIDDKYACEFGMGASIEGIFVKE